MMKGNGNNFLDSYCMSRIPAIKHVFFDLDHTLWDFDRNSRFAFEHIFRENRINVGLDVFLEVYVPINFQYWKYYRESRITKEKLRYGRLQQSFAKLGYAIDDHLINRLSEDYIKHLTGHNHLFEGTLELLEDLHKKYDLHIITNGFQEVQALKLNKSGMAPYFKTVTTSEAAGVKKPDPKIFDHALRLAGAKNSNSVMVGDTYEADILGAQAVGMQTICFNYHKADLIATERKVERLLDILDYL